MQAKMNLVRLVVSRCRPFLANERYFKTRLSLSLSIILIFLLGLSLLLSTIPIFLLGC